MTTYNVYRDGVKIATGLTEKHFIDTTVEDNKSYSYTITAVENSTESSPSPSLPVIVPLRSSNILQENGDLYYREPLKATSVDNLYIDENNNVYYSETNKNAILYKDDDDNLYAKKVV